MLVADTPISCPAKNTKKIRGAETLDHWTAKRRIPALCTFKLEHINVCAALTIRRNQGRTAISTLSCSQVKPGHIYTTLLGRVRNLLILELLRMEAKQGLKLCIYICLLYKCFLRGTRSRSCYTSLSTPLNTPAFSRSCIDTFGIGLTATARFIALSMLPQNWSRSTPRGILQPPSPL